MCGIAGYIGTAPPDESRIRETLHRMRYRGPDHSDYRTFQRGQTGIVLLHSRLSIVDLDARSNQPFSIGDATLVFNGEIYNYVELRTELEQRGVRFRTDSDTEVLLQSYLTWGEACVEQFEGMWSFAIYDRRINTLLLSRDRFAEKPLFYCRTPTGLYFGSEVKFLKGLGAAPLNVNRRQVLRYMVNGYKSLYKTEDTFFEGVRELGFATNLVLGEDGTERIHRYWTPRHTPASMSLEQSIEAVRERLVESIRIRLRADVPLAFCLSGGVDSAAIASIAAKVLHYDVASFSIVDSDERYNERTNIQATIDDLGCRHTIIETSRKGFFDRLAGLIDYHDAPLCTISYYVHSFLSEAISKQGYRVACSGTGADELFTGYYDHFNLHLYEIRHSPQYPTCLEQWRRHTATVVRNPHLQDPELYFHQPGFRDHIYLNSDVFAACMKAGFVEPFAEEQYCSEMLHNRMMNELFHEVTRPILHEDDLNSMRYSVENRSPYLDSQLFAAAFSVPTEYLVRDGYAKYILREAVKSILNDTVRLDRKKVGFNASITSLVDFRDPETIDFLLADGPVFDLVDREKLAPQFARDPMPNSFSKFLFSFINAKIFLEQAQD